LYRNSGGSCIWDALNDDFVRHEEELGQADSIIIIGFAGVFLINIIRLFVVFLTFEFVGPAMGNIMHLFVGYILFVVWVMVFWWMSFKYISPVAPTTVDQTPMIDGKR